MHSYVQKGELHHTEWVGSESGKANILRRQQTPQLSRPSLPGEGGGAGPQIAYKHINLSYQNMCVFENGGLKQHSYTVQYCTYLDLG